MFHARKPAKNMVLQQINIINKSWHVTKDKRDLMPVLSQSQSKQTSIIANLQSSLQRRIRVALLQCLRVKGRV